MIDQKNFNVPGALELSLKEFVDRLDDSRTTEREKFRRLLSEIICCSPVTMAQKIRENRWNEREKQKIADFLHTPIETLFP